MTSHADAHADIDHETAAALSADIAALASGASRWTGLLLADRAALLAETHRAISKVGEEWAMTAAGIKMLSCSSPLVGEEWMSGPYATLAGFGTAVHSLAALAAGRSPLHGVTSRAAPGGRLAWRVLPHSLRERILFHGFRAEVWTRPGYAAAEIVSGARPSAPDAARPPVTLVLGAGNITSIGPLDVLSELVGHGRSSLLKVNPTLSALVPVYRAALAPLIAADLVRVVEGDGAIGAHLAAHDGIGHIHITGSARTHDAIVWGAGADADERRAAGRPRIAVPITSELGGVAPVIVVPGAWSAADLRYQAEHVATMRLHNAGHNCIAAQVVVLDERWDQRAAFVRELHAAFARIADRAPWYPGSADRLRDAEVAHPLSSSFAGGHRVIVEAKPGTADVETVEYFSPVLGIVDVSGGDPKTFLDNAIAYANEKLAGTLGANVIIAPRERRGLGRGFEKSLAGLRYGAIGVNAWTGLAFLTPTATWGAFPGHTIDDVGSGIGVVHNGLLIPHTERTVVSGPFRPFPRSFAGGEPARFPNPPWFVTARSAAATGPALTGNAAQPGWAKLPGIFARAFRA